MSVLSNPAATSEDASVMVTARYRYEFADLHAAAIWLRVRTVDAALRRVLADTPDATVVALGEGFKTQFWRVVRRMLIAWARLFPGAWLRELPGLTDLHEVPQAGGDRLLDVLRRVPVPKSQLPAFPVFQARLGLDTA